MKHKRVWTDEQRAAAGERARLRFTKKLTGIVPGHTTEILSDEQMPGHIAVAVRPPEVQAVIDTMDPIRRAKLQGIQARNLATLSQTKEGQEALQRLEARHQNIPVQELANAQPGAVVNLPDLSPETRAVVQQVLEITKPIIREIPMKVPFRLTGSISGQMISELGACQCGEAKLKWHPICLKVKV